MPATTTTTDRPRFNRAYATAVRKLVDGFSKLDHDAVKGMAQAANEEVYAFPMWGTCFLVEDSCDRSKIRDMLRSFEPQDAEEAVEMVVDYGLGVEPEEYDIGTGSDDEDEDGFVEAVIDAWREGDFEEEMLSSSGWQRVGNTGILALDLGGDDLLLGINGAGFSFYGNVDQGERDGLWCRLYDALGYTWHHAGFREDVVHAAVRALCATESLSAEERRALRTLRVVQSYAGQGGPLTAAEIEHGEAI